jgi:hypothetical protein
VGEEHRCGGKGKDKNGVTKSFDTTDLVG